VRKLGVEFRWSPFHQKGAALEKLRQIGDPLADAVLAEVRLAAWSWLHAWRAGRPG